MFRCELGLDRVRDLFLRLGSPAPRRGYIHIAGTNGKGSVGSMLEAGLRRAGFRTGFYTSPHLISPLERIRVAGRAVTEERWERTAQRLMAVTKEATYFEFVTMLAAMIFAEEEVDYVLWETGMGGRLDATNVVTPIASVITNIALDHQAFLGGTLAEIAREKAGIIKPGVPVFSGAEGDAAEIIAETARRCGAPLFSPEKIKKEFDYRGNKQYFTLGRERVVLSLIGPMQRRNAALAFQVLARLATEAAFDLNDALAGWEEVRWPGRVQCIDDVIIDGAHNPDGAKALAEALRERFPGELFSLVFGAFHDKDASGGLRELLPLARELIFTPVPAEGRPSRTPEELAQMSGARTTVPVSLAENLPAALRKARAGGEKTLVAGSLFLAGAALRELGEFERVLNLD